MKIVTIGLNHAGTTLVRTLRTKDKKVEVVAYDKNDNVSFLGCGIALWVKGTVKDPKGLFYATPELLAKEDINVNMNFEATKIDPKTKKIHLKNLKTNEEIIDSYDKLVISSGSWPIIPNLPGIDLENIKIVKWYQHGKQVKDLNDSKQIKNVVIIGAGYIGVELAEAFRAKDHKVTLLDLTDRILYNYYDKEVTDIATAELEKNGVLVKTNEEVLEFIGEHNKVKKVKTSKNQYDADLVILAIGFRPDTNYLKGVVDLAPNGAIKTNRFLQTSNKDIYAIGDCVEVYDNSKQKESYIALATTAVRTGVVAALNILTNNKVPELGFQGANAISIFDYKFASVGVTETIAKKNNIEYESYIYTDNDRPEFMPTYEKVTLKVVWHKKTREIIGAQIVSKNNHTEVIHMFSLAILKKFKIDELALLDIFFLPHFNKPYNFITQVGLDVLGIDYMSYKKD